MDRSFKIFIAVLVTAIIVFLGYSQIKRWHHARLRSALENEQAACEKKIDALREEISAIEKELDELQGTGAYQERLSEIFGERSEYLSFGDDISCTDLELQIQTFINYLEKQNYMGSYKGKGGARRLFQEINERLSQAPPMLSGELEDLISLISNVTHLYRQLGKERIKVVKEMLRNESDIIETVIAIFYSYYIAGDRCQNKVIGTPESETLYEYAGYFLNTLSGRSCLLRRDSKIRVLASYYSVLTIDRANDEMLNSHGIDIRPFIDYSFYEISSQKKLIYRNQYLTKLDQLRIKYGS